MNIYNFLKAVSYKKDFKYVLQHRFFKTVFENSMFLLTFHILIGQAKVTLNQ